MNPIPYLFKLFGDAVIALALRTPYWHLPNADGTPYMDRYWLLRIGQDGVDEHGNPIPWVALRVHHIRSSDEGLNFHDHPWDFCSWILRGGYLEDRPYDGTITSVDLRHCPGGEVYTRDEHIEGDLLYRRATDWHRLRLPQHLADEGTWTLVLTLPKKQSWGFLVDGRKIYWRDYLRVRKLAHMAALALAIPRRGRLA